jgi:hypothetical protein
MGYLWSELVNSCYESQNVHFYLYKCWPLVPILSEFKFAELLSMINLNIIIPLRRNYITKAVFLNDILMQHLCLFNIPTCHLHELNIYIFKIFQYMEQTFIVKPHFNYTICRLCAVIYSSIMLFIERLLFYQSSWAQECTLALLANIRQFQFCA